MDIVDSDELVVNKNEDDEDDGDDENDEDEDDRDDRDRDRDEDDENNGDEDDENNEDDGDGDEDDDDSEEKYSDKMSDSDSNSASGCDETIPGNINITNELIEFIESFSSLNLSELIDLSKGEFPHAAFERIVREIAQDYSNNLRFSWNTFDILQSAAESYLLQIFTQLAKKNNVSKQCEDIQQIVKDIDMASRDRFIFEVTRSDDEDESDDSDYND